MMRSRAAILLVSRYQAVATVSERIWVSFADLCPSYGLPGHLGDRIRPAHDMVPSTCVPHWRYWLERGQLSLLPLDGAFLTEPLVRIVTISSTIWSSIFWLPSSGSQPVEQTEPSFQRMTARGPRSSNGERMPVRTVSRDVLQLAEWADW
jgi:hypothetical protein